MTQKDARKTMLWRAIEHYRVADSTEEQVEKKEALDNYIDDMLDISSMDEVALNHAHRMALELECVLSDGAYSNRWYKSAMQVLSEYRSAMNAIHEKHSPTFMGEPVLRGVSDAQAQPSVAGHAAHTTGESSGHPTMQDAIDAGDGCLHSTIDALQTRVAELEAQAAVEPVAWMGYAKPETQGEVGKTVALGWYESDVWSGAPLYTSPPDHTAEIERLKMHIKHIGNDALRSENHAMKEAMRLALEELRFYRSCYGGSGSSLAAIATLEKEIN